MKMIKKFTMFPSGSISVSMNRQIETAEERKQFMKEFEGYIEASER